MVSIIFSLLLLFPIYMRWFAAGSLSSGDWGYRYTELSSSLSPWIVSWSTYFGNGLGGGKMILAPLDTWYIFTAQIGSHFSIPWEMTERLVWFFPLIVLGVFSGISLSREVTRSRLSFLGILYVLNTYFIVVLSGGQMGVIWAIAFAPLVLLYSIRLVDSLHGKEAKIIPLICCVGLVSSIQLMFDARILYVTLLAVVIYALCSFVYHGMQKTMLFRLIVSASGVGGIVACLHAYWIVPLIMYRSPISATLGQVYLSADALRFFSFADFSHALALLHPNWPENIFGKTSFLRPEFLVFPIVAFSALLFVSKESGYKKIKVLYFAFIGLLGAFLAKGVNPHFGSMYEWMFAHVPGFIMFRDPTKFYVLIALSYTVLIPYTLDNVSAYIGKALKGVRFSAFVRIGAVGIFLGVLAFAYRDFYAGNIRGTFVPQSVPWEYVDLKNFLRKDDGFARILWVPSRSRYGYFDDDKRAISLDTLSIASPSAFIPWISDPINDEQLARYGVKYIIVPMDVKGELFVTDRKYDSSLRLSVITTIDDTERFMRLPIGGSLAVYAVPRVKEHAFIDGKPDVQIKLMRNNAASYSIVLPDFSSDVRLVFSETYNPFWRLSVDGVEITPTKSDDGLQVYTIPSTLSGTGTLSFIPQRIVTPMLWLAAVTGVVVGLILLRFS